jgi:multidrug efflux pump subunit AcrB
VSLSVIKRSGENLIEISDRVKRLLSQRPLPPGTNVVIQADQSTDIRQMVKDLENNILSGLILVVGVLLFSQGVTTLKSKITARKARDGESD